VNTIRTRGLVGALLVGLALSGCATTQQGGLPASDHERAPESKRHDGPNAGAVLGAGCGRASIEALRAGPLAVPVSIAIVGVCLPVAVGVGVLHAAAPDLGLGTSAVPDTGPIAMRKLTDAERSAFPQGSDGAAELRTFTAAERSVFPQSSAGGCGWGDCYSYKTADNGPVEMRKLSGYERSVFPTRFQAGCWAYGYC
jgi:hypothetical protein